jgi:hypothetical protein
LDVGEPQQRCIPYEQFGDLSGSFAHLSCLPVLELTGTAGESGGPFFGLSSAPAPFFGSTCADKP